MEAVPPRPPEPVFFDSAAAMRDWLVENHADAAEVVVGFWKVHTGKPSLTWSESVDAALCVGWIDGVRRSLGEDAYTIRFTPRRPRSIWSRVNIEKYAALLAAGQVLPAGAAAYTARRSDRSEVYSYEQRGSDQPDAEQEAALRAEAGAWEWFQAQPPSYRKTALHWVTSAKKAETRERRLVTLVADCAAGRKLRQLDPALLPSARAKAAAKAAAESAADPGTTRAAPNRRRPR
jgi:uncharacterized protein YdeI (YjbR/CyaY-like superfamily)